MTVYLNGITKWMVDYGTSNWWWTKFIYWTWRTNMVGMIPLFYGYMDSIRVTKVTKISTTLPIQNLPM